VFTLGVVAYQMVTGETRTPGANARGKLERLGVPDALVNLIVSSVSDPEDRPPDAAAWAAALSSISGGPAAPPAGVAAQAINVSVPGTWYSRPAADSDAKWIAVGFTPGPVTFQPDRVYDFRVADAVTDRHLDGVSALSSLALPWYLNLAGCGQVTDAGLGSLTALAGLRSLTLRSCGQVTDAGLAHLTALSGLRFLDLAFCVRVTDVGLNNLAALTNLEQLTVNYCPGVTDGGVKALQRVLPKCRIDR
jgi:hypothetical protein